MVAMKMTMAVAKKWSQLVRPDPLKVVVDRSRGNGSG